MTQIISFQSFSINGNKIGIVLTENNFQTIKNNHSFLKKITQLGKKNRLDSIGVLKTNNSTNYSLKIFEPNSSPDNNQSCWSNTCGNGLIAVNRFIRKKMGINNPQTIYINTDSGTKEIISSPKQTTINMGKLYLYPDLNSSQRRETNFILSKEPEVCSDIWHGYLSNNKNKKGEPHLMVEMKHMNLSQLYSRILNLGPKVTNNPSLYKNGINTNIVSVISINQKQKNIKFYIMTYERNLGNIPSKCVTGSCGTGSVTTFAFLLKKYHLMGNWGGFAISKQGTTYTQSKNNEFFLLDYHE